MGRGGWKIRSSCIDDEPFPEIGHQLALLPLAVDQGRQLVVPHRSTRLERVGRWHHFESSSLPWLMAGLGGEVEVVEE